MDLGHALDELYGETPDRFVLKRAELAKAAKAAGDKELASQIEQRRKPTTTAWILNQLARRRPDDVAALVDAGRALQRAQRKAMRGEASDLRGAIQKQRDVVASVAETTAHMMDTLGVDAEQHLPDVARALQAALVDPVVGAQLEEGRLEKTPEAAAQFPGAETAETGDVVAREPPQRAKHDKATGKESAREQRRRRMLEDARAELADAEQHVADVEARFEEERARATALEQEAQRLADEAEKAAGDAHTARTSSDRVAAELDQAKRAVERANARVDELRASSEGAAAR